MTIGKIIARVIITVLHLAAWGFSLFMLVKASDARSVSDGALFFFTFLFVLQSIYSVYAILTMFRKRW